MKRKTILIIWTMLCLTSCEKMIAIVNPELSFQANGEKFKATGSNTLSILKVSDKGFSIIFREDSWDTHNTMEDATISLNCGFFDGTLEEGVKYTFNAEHMDCYPYFKHIVNEYFLGFGYKSRIMWYNSSVGWIEISKINTKRSVISGNFEFTAICDDPSNDNIIEITKGSFKHISYEVIED